LLKPHNAPLSPHNASPAAHIPIPSAATHGVAHSSSSSTSAIDIPTTSNSKSSKERPSKSTTSSSPSSSLNSQITVSPGTGSLRKRKKSKSEAEERANSVISHPIILADPNASTISLPAVSAFVQDATAEDQATEAVRLLKLHFKRLKREKEEFRTATEAFQQQQRRFEETIAQMDKYTKVHGEGNVVKLNVGGVTFQTTSTTLTSQPDSMLSAMFSGRYKLPTDEKGRIFIDRDGTNFRYILNFLRDGTLNAPYDQILLMDLLQEAQFYQLHELVQLVKIQLKEIAKQQQTLSLLQPTAPNTASPGPIPAIPFAHHKLTSAHRALSISDLAPHRTHAMPRTGTSPDFDDYWGHLEH